MDFVFSHSVAKLACYIKNYKILCFNFWIPIERMYIKQFLTSLLTCSGNSMSRSIVYSNSNYVVACSVACSYGEVSNYNECMPATVLNKTSTVPCTPMAPGCISLAYLIDLE